MDTAHITYHGDLRTTCTHVRSGTPITTDAPVDNKGKGEAFSPTDLLATALGSCIITTMAIAAHERSITLKNLSARVIKRMAAGPRRVEGVEVYVELDGTGLGDKERKVLERAARTCPVTLSLAPELSQEISIVFL